MVKWKFKNKTEKRFASRNHIDCTLYIECWLYPLRFLLLTSTKLLTIDENRLFVERKWGERNLNRSCADHSVPREGERTSEPSSIDLWSMFLLYSAHLYIQQSRRVSPPEAGANNSAFVQIDGKHSFHPYAVAGCVHCVCVYVCMCMAGWLCVCWLAK